MNFAAADEISRFRYAGGYFLRESPPSRLLRRIVRCNNLSALLGQIAASASDLHLKQNCPMLSYKIAFLVKN
jgi:hypothetical protein